MPTIYKLINPLTDKTYYVGFTTKTITERLVYHLINPISKSTIDLIAAGLKPIIEVIEEGDNVTTETEKYWIKRLDFEGHFLENRDGLIVYQNRDYIFTIPDNLLNSIDMTDNERLALSIKIVLDELPLSSNIPIVIRIKTILEWALSQK